MNELGFAFCVSVTPDYLEWLGFQFQSGKELSYICDADYDQRPHAWRLRILETHTHD